MPVSKREMESRLPHKLQIGRHIIHPVRELAPSDDLDRDLRHQPSLYAWYGSLHSKAVKMWQDAKQDVLERLEDLQNEYKEKERAAGRTAKEADAKLYARTDERVRMLWRRQTMLNAKRNQMYTVLHAAEQRGYLLQTLASNKRKSFDAKDSVSKHNYEGSDDE